MTLKPHQYIVLISLFNTLLYHLPLIHYIHQRVGDDINFWALSGVLMLFTLIVTSIIFTIFTIVLQKYSKWLFVVLFNINAVAFYFMHSHSIVLSRSMIANIVNTNVAEATELFSIYAVLYWLALGVIPSIVLCKVTLQRFEIKSTIIQTIVLLMMTAILVYTSSIHWAGWINRHQKMLGGLVLPWSYIVNTPRYITFKNKHLQKEIGLPTATIDNKNKALFVLVIGEASRRENFSLYGYHRNTTPQLDKLEQQQQFTKYYANSCATYTRASVKCMLEHTPSKKRYEPLPNYLHRAGVDVIWRTTNDGEPPLKIAQYHNQTYLAKHCQGEHCAYDDTLLSGIGDIIKNSQKDKMLLVLHTNTSHGARYDKRYPQMFEKYSPICQQSDPSQCKQSDLINTYDNTIVYTDHLLAKLTKQLSTISDRKVAMLYVSDHGESLGEEGFYFHTADKSIAPKQQYQVPYILWTSDTSVKPRLDIGQSEQEFITQHTVFHTVMDFLEVTSPVYDANMSIFEKK